MIFYADLNLIRVLLITYILQRDRKDSLFSTVVCSDEQIFLSVLIALVEHRMYRVVCTFKFIALHELTIMSQNTRFLYEFRILNLQRAYLTYTVTVTVVLLPLLLLL